MKPITTRSKEEYLKAILKVKKKKGVCRNLYIVDEMNVSKASVSIAMKKLEQDNLITRDDWGINLTDKGKQVAESLYERDLFFVTWLKEIGVSEKTAEEDACMIEHAVSEESFSKMCRYLEACRNQVRNMT